MHILPDTAIVKIIDDGDAGVVAITSAACIVNETAVWSGLPDVKSLNTFTDLHNVHCIESAGTMGVLFTVDFSCEKTGSGDSRLYTPGVSVKTFCHYKIHQPLTITILENT